MVIPSNSSSTGQTIIPRRQTALPSVETSPQNTGGGGGLDYDPNAPVYAGEPVPATSIPPAVDPITGAQIADPVTGEIADPVTGEPTSETPGYDPTSFRETVGDIYAEGSPEIEAARVKAQEAYGGSGLLFSDIAARGGEAAAMDAAMKLAAPDTQFQQGLAASEQQFGFQKDLAEQGFGHQSELGKEQNQYNTEMAAQMNKYDTETQKRLQGFNKENAAMQNGFQKELQSLGFSQDMEAALLNTMQNMMSGGMQSMTSLAMSGEATPAEVKKIQESLRNQMKTFTNIWKGSAGSKDTFDFSGIGA